MQDFGLRSAVIALALALPALPVLAGHPGLEPDKVEARMQAAIDRLDLTAEQRGQLDPVVREHVAQLQAVRAKYPADASREQKREMVREVRALHDGYEAKLRAVLTDEQEKKWEAMREEHRERMRDQARHRHADAPEKATQ